MKNMSIYNVKGLQGKSTNSGPSDKTDDSLKQNYRMSLYEITEQPLKEDKNQ